MSYDDWKTTDPNDALHCENGHYMCPHRCPICKGCVESCDCEREDEEADITGKPAPLNPAPEVQPVPTGYRLGEGWKAGGALHPGGYTAVYCDMLHMAEAVYVRRNEDGNIVEGACRDHAIHAGALVPIEPTAVPEGQQGEHHSECEFSEYGVCTCAERRAEDAEGQRSHCPKHPLSMVREERTYPGGVTVPALPCEECAMELRRRPEGQQGEAKASEFLAPGERFPVEINAASAKASEPAITRMSRQLVGATQEIVTMHDRIAALESELAEAEKQVAFGKMCASEYQEAFAREKRTADAREAAMRAAAADALTEIDDILSSFGQLGKEAVTFPANPPFHPGATETVPRPADEIIYKALRRVRTLKKAIERLPLSTGEDQPGDTREGWRKRYIDLAAAQPDDIKAAVTARENELLSELARRGFGGVVAELYRNGWGRGAPGTVEGGK